MLRLPGVPAAALLSVVVAVAATSEAFVLLQDVDLWRRSHVAALGHQAGAVVLIASAVAAAAAALVASVRHTTLGVTAEVADRSLAVASRTVVAVAVPAVAVHAIGGIVAIVVARRWGLEGAPPVLRWLSPAIAILASAGLGVAIGWRAHTALAAPLAAVLVFTVLAVVSRSISSEVLDLATGPAVIGMRTDGSWAAWTAAVLLAVALGGVLSTGRRAVAVTGVALATVVVLAGVLTGPGKSLQPARAATCGGTDPEVCAFPERRGKILGVRREVRRISAALDTVAGRRIALPERFSELDMPDAASLEVADPDDRLGRISDVLAAAARCSAEREPDPPLILAVAAQAYGRGVIRPKEVSYEPAPSRLTPSALGRDAKAAAERLRPCP